MASKRSDPPPNSPTAGGYKHVDLVFDKGLPANPDAERFVLGSIMLGVPFSEVAAALAAEDFSLQVNRTVFAAMGALAERSEKIDRVTLANELMGSGKIDAIGGFSFLISLDEGLPKLDNLDAYCRIVQEKSKLRQLIFASQKVIDRALIQDAAAAEIAAEASEKLVEIQLSGDAGQDGGQTPQQVIESFEGGISAFLDPSSRMRGLPTGFTKFDEMIGGLKPGEIYIIAARPGAGKTALALNIAQFLATDPRQRRAVTVFSLEMSAESLLLRMACGAGRVDIHKMRAGYLNQDERRKLQLGVADLIDSRLVFYDNVVTMPDIVKGMRRQAKDGMHLAIVDYLQLIGSHSSKNETRNDAVSIISRQFKLLAKELAVPIIILSQLSRVGERRSDSRPILSDLRDSGCIAGDSLVTIASTGLRVPIRDLVGVENFKVWSRNADASEPAVCTKAFTSLFKQLWEIKTSTGKRIRATANHKFMTAGGWRRLDELAVGDELCTYLPIPEPLSPVSIPTNELFLLGHLLGNGCLLPRHAAQYTTRHEDLAKAVAASASTLFGDDLNPRIEYYNPRDQGGWFQVYFSSQRKHTHGVYSALTEWAKDLGFFGLRSAVKIIPAKVFGCSNDSLGIFLGALWETDGTFGTRTQDGKEWRSAHYSTSSRIMAEQVQYLLARLSIPSSVSLIKQGKHKPNFTVRIVGGADGLRTFFELLTFTGRHHQAIREVMMDSLRLVSGRSTTTYIANNGILKESIVSIEPDFIEECFDMTVPITHNMEVSCFVTHNSIEQDADLVAFVFREEMYKRDREDLRGIAELIVAKQRNGPIGNVPLRFMGQFTRFENRAEDLPELP